jgi:hypothetical protein
MLYIIWSEEHQAWWRPGGSGYTRSLLEAGRYSQKDAVSIVTDANKAPSPARSMTPYVDGLGFFNEVAFKDPFE